MKQVNDVAINARGMIRHVTIEQATNVIRFNLKLRTMEI